VAVESFPIHDAALAGNAPLLEELIAAQGDNVAREIERVTPDGFTALMLAVMSPRADVAMVERLIACGAAIFRCGGRPLELGGDALTFALRAGDVRKVDALVRAGADILYVRSGYTALLDCLFGRAVHQDQRLPDLVRYLIDKKVDLDSETEHAETALRVLSRLRRFDVVKILLDAGANEDQLAWNPLLRAVAFGDDAQVAALLEAGADPEARDWWKRTAWLVAISAGNLAAAERLRRAGAVIDAKGRCGKPPLFYAIETHNLPMLRHLLEAGCDAQAVDEFGGNALMEAAEHGLADAIQPLLEAGIDINAEGKPYTALASTSHPEIAQKLLDAGADPAEITQESRRALVGLPKDSSVRFLAVTPEEFRRGAARRFGNANPERIDQPFWIAMIRAGVNAWAAAEAFKEVSVSKPVWCADRFGQSITFLPDGRVIQVAGEHEDYYDPDFCIYNDVFVHEPDGVIRIYGYPKELFPPTDFHTATLSGRKVYLIGSLGYSGERRFGSTPVFTLDIDDFRIARIETSGVNPGWIHDHRARLCGNEIVVSGGTIAVEVNEEEDLVTNEHRFALSLDTLTWRRLPE
jgi:ankyrin repeat protein